MIDNVKIQLLDRNKEPITMQHNARIDLYAEEVKRLYKLYPEAYYFKISSGTGEMPPREIKDLTKKEEKNGKI